MLKLIDENGNQRIEHAKTVEGIHLVVLHDGSRIFVDAKDRYESETSTSIWFADSRDSEPVAIFEKAWVAYTTHEKFVDRVMVEVPESIGNCTGTIQ